MESGTPRDWQVPCCCGVLWGEAQGLGSRLKASLSLLRGLDIILKSLRAGKGSWVESVVKKFQEQGDHMSAVEVLLWSLLSEAWVGGQRAKWQDEMAAGGMSLSHRKPERG